MMPLASPYPSLQPILSDPHLTEIHHSLPSTRRCLFSRVTAPHDTDSPPTTETNRGRCTKITTTAVREVTCHSSTLGQILPRQGRDTITSNIAVRRHRTQTGRISGNRTIQALGREEPGMKVKCIFQTTATHSLSINRSFGFMSHCVCRWSSITKQRRKGCIIACFPE